MVFTWTRKLRVPKRRIQTDCLFGLSVNQVSSESRTLNLLGFFCPIPINETRIALGECSEGDTIKILCDDHETLRDIPLLCDRMGVTLLSVDENAGEYTFMIAKIKPGEGPQ